MSIISKDGSFYIDEYTFKYSLNGLISALNELNKYNRYTGKPNLRLAFDTSVSNNEVLEILLGVQC